MNDSVMDIDRVSDADLDRASIIRSFEIALRVGKKYTEPYLHYEFRPFAPGLYAEMLAHLPADTSYFELKHPDAARPDGTSARRVLPLGRKDLVAKLPPAQRAFWAELNDILCGNEIREIFLQAFEPVLIERFNCPLSDVPAIPKLMLMRDMASYKISIHHDIDWKTITTQYYLPPDHEQQHLGTSIYRREPDGKFTETHRMDFTPGNSYGFAVTKHSWHAVKPVGEIPRARNSMMLIYFGKEGHDY
jgi:hypothetical protein